MYFCRFLSHIGHANIERDERVCHLCYKQSVGNEYHYIIFCPGFNLERSKYLDTKRYKHPDGLVMETLFNSKDIHTTSNLSKFCRTIMDRCKTDASQVEPKTKKCKEKAKTKRPVTEAHPTT